MNIFVGGTIGADMHVEQAPTVKGVPFTDEDLLPVLAGILVEKFGGKMKSTSAAV